MAKTYIFGHKNPDTDAISSAIIMAEFEQLRGNSGAKAYRLGDVSAETQFALDTFNVPAPELLTDDLDGQDVILVDHNEFQQSSDTIASATIKHVIDHHRIANFETAGAEADTTYGKLGVKVWIYRGEVLPTKNTSGGGK